MHKYNKTTKNYSTLRKHVIFIVFIFWVCNFCISCNFDHFLNIWVSIGVAGCKSYNSISMCTNVFGQGQTKNHHGNHNEPKTLHKASTKRQPRLLPSCLRSSIHGSCPSPTSFSHDNPCLLLEINVVWLIHVRSALRSRVRS